MKKQKLQSLERNLIKKISRQKENENNNKIIAENGEEKKERIHRKRDTKRHHKLLSPALLMIKEKTDGEIGEIEETW